MPGFGGNGRQLGFNSSKENTGGFKRNNTNPWDNKNSAGDTSVDNNERTTGFGGFQKKTNENFKRTPPQKGIRNSTNIISFPSDKISRFIGKGGSNINELQDKCGCKFKIISNQDDGFTVPIQVIGNANAVFKGNNALNDMIESFKSMKSSITSWTEREPQKEVVAIDWTSVIKNCTELDSKKWDGFPNIIKNFYIEHNDIMNMSNQEAELLRSENMGIKVEDLHPDKKNIIPNPVHTFQHAFHNYPDILKEIKKAGFDKPSPIQMQGWPIAMQGKDMIGIAQTGTGKTLAFLLPAFIHIANQITPMNERLGPTCLVLSPTRELAIQIEEETKKYKYKNIRCCCIYGGGKRNEQIAMVKKGVEIIVATPGRLNDLINNSFIDIRTVTYLVLDEADKMLDMGFEPEIRKVLLDIRPDRQTVMTSATWPEGVRQMANSYMVNPIQVFVGTLDLTACHSVTQVVEIIEDEDKRNRLTDIITNLKEDEKMIVFIGKKAVVDDLSCEYALNGFSVQSIHGGREQIDREIALSDFTKGGVNVLLATDVASRGLDVKDITHVLNYDFPRNIEDYVHRVGRTGRAGRSGTSLTFFTKREWRSSKALIKILVEANQVVPDELALLGERSNDKRFDNSGSGCYNCGEEGHISRDCPNASRSGRGRGGRGGGFRGQDRGRGGQDGGRGRGGRSCYTCGRSDHMSRDCPQGKDYNPFAQKKRGRGRGRKDRDEDPFCGFSF